MSQRLHEYTVRISVLRIDCALLKGGADYRVCASRRSHVSHSRPARCTNRGVASFLSGAVDSVLPASIFANAAPSRTSLISASSASSTSSSSSHSAATSGVPFWQQPPCIVHFVPEQLPAATAAVTNSNAAAPPVVVAVVSSGAAEQSAQQRASRYYATADQNDDDEERADEADRSSDEPRRASALGSAALSPPSSVSATSSTSSPQQQQQQPQNLSSRSVEFGFREKIISFAIQERLLNHAVQIGDDVDGKWQSIATCQLDIATVFRQQGLVLTGPRKQMHVHYRDGQTIRTPVWTFVTSGGGGHKIRTKSGSDDSSISAAASNAAAMADLMEYHHALGGSCESADAASCVWIRHVVVPVRIKAPAGSASGSNKEVEMIGRLHLCLRFDAASCVSGGSAVKAASSPSEYEVSASTMMAMTMMLPSAAAVDGDEQPRGATASSNNSTAALPSAAAAAAAAATTISASATVPQPPAVAATVTPVRRNSTTSPLSLAPPPPAPPAAATPSSSAPSPSIPTTAATSPNSNSRHIGLQASPTNLNATRNNGNGSAANDPTLLLQELTVNLVREKLDEANLIRRIAELTEKKRSLVTQRMLRCGTLVASRTNSNSGASIRSTPQNADAISSPANVADELPLVADIAGAAAAPASADRTPPGATITITPSRPLFTGEDDKNKNTGNSSNGRPPPAAAAAPPVASPAPPSRPQIDTALLKRVDAAAQTLARTIAVDRITLLYHTATRKALAELEALLLGVPTKSSTAAGAATATKLSSCSLASSTHLSSSLHDATLQLDLVKRVSSNMAQQVEAAAAKLLQTLAASTPGVVVSPSAPEKEGVGALVTEECKQVQKRPQIDDDDD